MLELHSRAEHLVSETLETMSAARVGGTPIRIPPTSQQRLHLLETRLGDGAFGGHGKHALTRLKRVCTLHNDRCWLAHGRFRPVGSGYAVDCTRYKGGARETFGPGTLSLFDMMGQLTQLDDAVRQLAGALGQIRRLCREGQGGAAARPG